MDPRLKRTAFAAKAATLAEQFQGAVGRFAFGQHRPEMVAPEGSTGGGVQALQHIRLVPPPGQGRTHVVGNANRIERVAELRSLAYIDAISLERWGQRTGFDPRTYGDFIAASHEFLEAFGCKVTYVEAPPPKAMAPAPAPAADSSVLGKVLWAIVLLSVGCAIGLLLRR